ncbi:hypothetical protein B0T24DRAFT_601957 [Lasiosphaeria ovina]|uniref:Uncharacterized protein n=1 Tax=Lasiosphaeria ovina TaxID=92902 RepID=A0AAE0TWZ0_9PEZI|nr:hypothetical protein B0T24DRAFT_601957 [Lasiosphaeria ovina]
MAAPRSPSKWPRLLAACFALITPCAAAELTNSAWDLTVGEPFVVAWTGTDAPVWIYLDENLVQGSTPPHFDAQQVLDFNDSSTAFTWTPPDNDGGRTWAFELSALGASTADYSPNFVIASAAGGSVSGTASSSTTAVTGGENGSGTSPSPSPSQTASSSAKSTTSATPSGDGGGLSTGAKAGIGIGAGLGGLVVLGLLGLLIFRLGKAAAADKKTTTTQDDQPGIAELGGAGKQQPGKLEELDGATKQQQQPQQQPGVVELGEAPRRTPELDAATAGGAVHAPSPPELEARAVTAEMYTHANTAEMPGGPGSYASYPAGAAELGR